MYGDKSTVRNNTDMNYLKYTQYVYLVISVLSIFKAVEVWNDGTDVKWLFVAIAAISMVVFVVRRNITRRIVSRGNSAPK
jgi:hypothetical protein